MDRPREWPSHVSKKEKKTEQKDESKPRCEEGEDQLCIVSFLKRAPGLVPAFIKKDPGFFLFFLFFSPLSLSLSLSMCVCVYVCVLHAQIFHS